MMRKIFLLSILFFIFCISEAINVDGRQSSREGKVFSLFNIVKFENSGCESTLDTVVSGKARNGTCYASSECGDKGGSSKGSCAAGFGVCCVFLFNTKTNTEVSYNNTYLQNPGYPTGYTGTEGISYTVKKCNDNICYLRIDFEDFSIYGPSNSYEYDEGLTWAAAPNLPASGGKCADDTFIVTAPSAASFTVPTICGKNAGEHIYIPMGNAATDTATIAFSFTNEHTRTYDLKLSQIECGDAASPPDGCLQYFTGTSGKIRTFNFLDATKTTTHLALQNYQVCMRKEDGYCCNQYTVCDETAQMNSFSLFPEASKLYTDADTFANVVTKCTQDYLTIPGGQSVCSTNPSLGGYQQTKFCGSKLAIQGNVAEANTKAHIPICACGGSFIVGIHTDDKADPSDITNAAQADWSRGACLDFKQQPC